MRGSRHGVILSGMNTKSLYVVSLLLLLTARNASAQVLQFTFTGVCATLDASGKPVGRVVNNQTLLKDFALVNGISPAGLALVYHIGGNDLGDTIDAINASNGTSLGTVFGLFFGEDFGRMALESADNTAGRRIEYIYTSQNSHSLGSALISTRHFLDSHGNTNRTSIYGAMQYLVTTDGNHPAVQVCNGNFVTGKALTFH